MRKGLSPLIAVVLLIAFTITVAAMIAAFSRTFVGDTTETSQREAAALTAECQFSGILIRSASYDPASNEVAAVIQNARSENLTDWRFNVFYSDTDFETFTPSGSNTTLGRGELVTLRSTINSTPSSLEVFSNLCPIEAIDRCLYRAGQFSC